MSKHDNKNSNNSNSNDKKPNMNEQLLNDLAALAERDAHALEKHVETLSGSADARDLVFDAEMLAAELGNAGADFEMPADLWSKVEAAYDARLTDEKSPAETEVAEATVPRAAITRSSQSTQHSQNTRHSQAAQPSTPSPTEETSGESKPATKRGAVVFLGALAAAAAVALGVFAWRGTTGEEHGTAINGATVNDGYTLTATVESVERSSGEGTVTAAGIPMSAGGTIAANTTVQTDRATRAELTLSDGSSVVLDRGTTVQIGAHGRTVTLEEGQIVADVAHLDEGPAARFLSERATVTVLGTKFEMEAGANAFSIRMARGKVRVEANGGAGPQSAEVRQGQEATVDREGHLNVYAATDLPRAISWADLKQGRQAEYLPGIGELRARVPGEDELDEEERNLELSHHAVRATVVGSIARTTVEEHFHNGSDEILEGVYSFPIPAGARIAGLQLKVDGEWVQGGFVAKSRGQEIWGDIIDGAVEEVRAFQETQRIESQDCGPRGFVDQFGRCQYVRDPALLEWQQGGRFELRVFPIMPNSSREVRITYEETIAPGSGQGNARRYAYPMPDMGEAEAIGNFEFELTARGARRVTSLIEGVTADNTARGQLVAMSARDYVANGAMLVDFELEGDEDGVQLWTFRGDAAAAPGDVEARQEDQEARDAQIALSEDSRGYVLFSLRPEIDMSREATPQDIAILVDASQSMVGDRMERAANLAEALVSEMSRANRVVAMVCDVTCRSMDALMTPSSEAAANVGAFIRNTTAAGATDLSASLTSAHTRLDELGAGKDGREAHMLYLGDGVASAGPREPSALAIVVENHVRNEGSRVSTIGIGQDSDDRLLGAVARAGGGSFVQHVPGRTTLESAYAALQTTFDAPLEHVEVTLPDGVELVSPTELPTLVPGNELLITGRTSNDVVRGEVVLRGKVGHEVYEARYEVDAPMSESGGNAFVPRVWAEQRIAALEEDGDPENEAEVLALSMAYNVMSRSTSLIVLEDDAMFESYGVDRSRPSAEWTEEAAESTRAVRRPARRATRRPSTNGAPSMPSSSGFEDELSAFSRGFELAPRQNAQTSAMPVSRLRSGGGFAMGRRRAPPRLLVSSEVNHTRALARVPELRVAVEAAPTSRDAHKALVRGLSAAGLVSEAETAARAWLELDPLDWEALTYLADSLGRQGKREEALRIQGGIVDLAADNVRLHRRMANAFSRSGESERECAHRVSLFELEASEQNARNAFECLTELGNTELIEYYSARLSGDVMNAAQTACPNNCSASSRRTSSPCRASCRPEYRGEAGLELRGSWDGDADLDMSLITREGTRISWIGGRVSVIGSDARSIGQERMGLHRLGAGRFVVEVSRTNVEDDEPLEGSIDVYRNGERHGTIEFRMRRGDTRTEAGTVRWSPFW